MSELAPPPRLSQHRILIVNDDGIDGTGLKMLEELARAFTDEVWVVAPDEEKSGFSHSISMTVPIRARKLDDRHYAVKGTPTDCALLGVRSIALSQVFTIGGPVHWATARRFAPAILERLLTCDWEPGSFVNVNFPDAPPEAVTGIRVTTQGRRLPGSFRPVRRVDERNFPYYWIKLAYETGSLEAGTDLLAIAENAVSVTPMQLDLTSNTFRHYLDRTFKEA